MTILNNKFDGVNLQVHYNLGLFCFVGIDEYGKEIIELIEPEIKLDMFFYLSSNKFQTFITEKYLNIEINGTIIFANGNECLCYKFKSGQFIKIFDLNGNLIKRHNKGGYSANRFARIAEESRHSYVVRICDKIKKFVNSENLDANIIIYGSDEIVKMILDQCPYKLFDGGFLNFNSLTIKNTKHWLKILEKIQDKNYDTIYQEILENLELKPDLLDFDPLNKNQMKYYIDLDTNDMYKLNDNQIPLLSNSKYYSQLKCFQYIGVKFFKYETDLDQIN